MSLVNILRKKFKLDFFTTPSHSQKFFIFSKLKQFYKYDISETDAYKPQEALMVAQKRAAKIYGTKSTYFLTNGSTSGIIASVLACVRTGEKVLLWDESHACHLNAVKLAGAMPVYYKLVEDGNWGIYTQTTAEIIEKKLKCEKIKAVIITSPTYEGVVSDVAKIKEVCKKYGAYLIVDEAHGALYPFCDKLPTSAIYGNTPHPNHFSQQVDTLPSTARKARQEEEMPQGEKAGQKHINFLQSKIQKTVKVCKTRVCPSSLAGEGDFQHERKPASVRKSGERFRNWHAYFTPHQEFLKLVTSFWNSILSRKGRGGLRLKHLRYLYVFAMEDRENNYLENNGADFVIQSLHKTAGGLNPTALLHCNLDIDVKNALEMITTTSPSYPLLASIEKNINFLNSKKGRGKILELIENIEDLKKNVQYCEFYEGDPTKILLKTLNLNGFELSEFLYKNGIEDEKTNEKSTMLLCGVGTDLKKLKKLERVLKKI